MERSKAQFVILVLAELPQSPAAGVKARIKDRPLITITEENLPRYRRSMESYGLTFLVNALAGIPQVKVKLWDVSKKDVLRDCQRAPRFDQSVCFKRIYEEGLGTLGGEPVGCIVPDHSLTISPEDMELAQRLSETAAAACAAVLYGIAPGFVGVDAWQELRLDYPAEWHRTVPEYPKWKALRAARELNFLFPLLPSVRRAGRNGISPGFLAAAVIGLAFREPGVRGLFRLESRPPFELEWDCPEDLQVALQEAGLNALSQATVAQAGFLQNLRPASDRGESPERPPSLAECIAESHLYHRWCDYARRKRVSGAGQETAALARQWLSEFEGDPGGFVNLPRLAQKLLTMPGVIQ